MNLLCCYSEKSSKVKKSQKF
uniref:Uncharacterized protein n=1 Tax=Arundo donax TaxID=35708 RepID=A0A0A9HDE7_ARUDO